MSEQGRVPPVETVWGDGFADDTWLDMIRPRRLDAYSDDELVRYFPNVIDSRSSVVDRFLAIVATRVNAQSLRRQGAGGFERHRRPSSRLEGVLDGRRGCRREAAVCEDRALAFLSDIMPRLSLEGDVGPALTTTFAFHAGFHPAYFWPEALVSHERETAAGWLGLLCRGRSALMSVDVADYLTSIFEVDAGATVSVIDPIFRALLGEARLDLDRLYASVRRCLGGSLPVVRRGLARPAQRADGWTLGPVVSDRQERLPL